MIEAWYPGQQSGSAIAATLFGEADPAGGCPSRSPARPRRVRPRPAVEYPGINNRRVLRRDLRRVRYYQHSSRGRCSHSATASPTPASASGRCGSGESVPVRFAVSGRRSVIRVVELATPSSSCTSGTRGLTGEPHDQLKGFAKRPARARCHANRDDHARSPGLRDLEREPAPLDADDRPLRDPGRLLVERTAAEPDGRRRLKRSTFREDNFSPPARNVVGTSYPDSGGVP